MKSETNEKKNQDGLTRHLYYLKQIIEAMRAIALILLVYIAGVAK